MDLSDYDLTVRFMEEAVALISDFNWIFSTRATHILVENILTKHKEVLNELAALDITELNKLPFGEIPSKLNSNLMEALTKCSALKLNIIEYKQFTFKKGKGMSRKKLQEATQLAKFVAEILHKENINSVIDVGSGLGYVDRMIIEERPSCKILGIETDESKCKTADTMNVGLDVEQLCLKVTDSNINTISNLVTQESCLIALHSCGDLTINCFKLLEMSENINSMVLMSCCYHKMTNYPLSNALNSVKIEYGTTFLRLASESTKERWSKMSQCQINQQAFNVLARAVIELYTFHRKLIVIKTKRKCVTKTNMTNWENYCNNWIQRHYITANGSEVDHSQILKELETYWETYKNQINLVVGLLALQNCFQSLAESLVHADRVLYLYEKNYKIVQLVRMVDPEISPRSIAIVVKK